MSATPAASFPALDAERAALAARLAKLEELKRDLAGIVALTAPDPQFAALAAAELRGVLPVPAQASRPKAG